jgi:hypothetical protein
VITERKSAIENFIRWRYTKDESAGIKVKDVQQEEKIQMHNKNG